MSSSNGQRPAQFQKLSEIQPCTSGHNIVVVVLDKAVVVDRQMADGTTLKIEEVLVGDDTGRAFFKARNEQCDLLQVDMTVELRNAKITMHNNKMRIEIDGWGVINYDTNRHVKEMEDIEYDCNVLNVFKFHEYKHHPFRHEWDLPFHSPCA